MNFASQNGSSFAACVAKHAPNNNNNNNNNNDNFKGGKVAPQSKNYSDPEGQKYDFSRKTNITESTTFQTTQHFSKQNISKHSDISQNTTTFHITQ